MTTLARTTPESVGISSDALGNVLAKLSELDSLNSIMILRHGKVCLEGWWKPYGPDQPHMLFSLSKSFVSAAIGIATGEGLLAVTDKLVGFFPECADSITDDRMRDMTLHDLLCMSSGHAACAAMAMMGDPDGDFVKAFLASSLSYTPGTHFVYNTGATYMLAAVIRKVTGLNVREYLQPRLFDPLSIAPGVWESCPKGTNFGGWGLNLKTEDIAKFANLLLHNGNHNGQQLIPADYLAEATRKQSDNSMNEAPDWKLGYGYQFWRCAHGFRGDGACGQYAIVVPEHGLAIAITSCLENMQNVLTILWDHLIPHLEAAPLPDDPAANEKLRAAASALSMPILPDDARHPVPRQTFEFQPNPASIHSLSVEVGQDECALTFHTDRGIEQLRAGFGSHRVVTFQLTDPMAHPTAASAAWLADDILEIQSFCLDGTYRDTYTIHFNDPKHPLRRTMRCSLLRPPMPELALL
jgi:CubicO group peptidase (beta-lactamase class C family)